MNAIFAAEQIGFPILSSLIVLPIIAAILLQFIARERAQKQFVLLAASLEMLLAVVAAVNFLPDSADLQFVEQRAWMPLIGASFHLGVDGISILFLPLTAFVILLTLLFTATNHLRTSRFYWTNILLFQAMTMGIFVALDLVLFFIFWELILIPSYFLIKLWGVGPQRQHAALKYIIYMLVGSAPLLISFVILGVNYTAAVNAGVAPAGQNFNFIELSKITIPRETQSLIFGLMILGFAIKAPVPPFHTWMPSVLMEGPIGISILLIGLKIGTYGMLRFVLPLLPDASIEWQTVMTWLGVFAILYGGFIALWQVNLRRLLAFASVSHVGLVLLGLFSLQEQGMQGSILAMINIGLSSTALVFLAGTLYRRTQSTELTALGGLARPMPRLAFFFFAIGLATIGMPGTSGFFGEFAIMWGAFEQHWQLAAVAVIGVALSAGYFLWYYERAFFGPAKPSPRATLRDLTGRETFAMSGVFALVIAIGLYPMPLLTMTASSVNALAERLDASRMAAQMQESPAAIVAKLGTGRETLCTTCNPGR